MEDYNTQLHHPIKENMVTQLATDLSTGKAEKVAFHLRKTRKISSHCKRRKKHIWNWLHDYILPFEYPACFLDRSVKSKHYENISAAAKY